MCIIVDTNCLPNVFNPASAKHSEFKPILDWITEGNGKVVFGGSQYALELQKFLGLFKELRVSNKAVHILDSIVDKKAAELAISHPQHNDQHIVGLLIESGCKLICSEDKEAYEFMTSPILFGSKKNRPKIYNNKKHVSLLIPSNISKCCKPSGRPNKAQTQEIKSILNLN